MSLRGKYLHFKLTAITAKIHRYTSACASSFFDWKILLQQLVVAKEKDEDEDEGKGCVVGLFRLGLKVFVQQLFCLFRPIRVASGCWAALHYIRELTNAHRGVLSYPILSFLSSSFYLLLLSMNNPFCYSVSGTALTVGSARHHHTWKRTPSCPPSLFSSLAQLNRDYHHHMYRKRKRKSKQK